MLHLIQHLFLRHLCILKQSFKIKHQILKTAHKQEAEAAAVIRKGHTYHITSGNSLIKILFVPFFHLSSFCVVFCYKF